MNKHGLVCAIAMLCGCGFDHGDPALADAPPGAVTVGFSASTSTTNEDESVELVVELSAPSAQIVTVAYAVTDGTATSADVTVSGSTVTFMPGETAKTIAVVVTNDTIDEPDETVSVTLSEPVNATLAATAAWTVTIVDDDSAPTVAFAQATASVNEATAKVSLTVQLSGESAFEVSVPFTVTGTADNPEDFTVMGGTTVVIPPGMTSATIAINVKTDMLDEADETVIVQLGTPTNATPGAVMSQTLTINDDDPAPTVGLTSSGASPNEGNNSIVLIFQLSDISGRDVTIPYSIDPSSTASEPADYTIAQASPLVIPAGSTSTTLTIAMKEDTEVEPDETVIVVMGTPINADIANPSVYTLVIRDDD